MKFVPLEELLPFPVDDSSSGSIVEMFSDASLAWWRKSLVCLRPPPPDDGTSAAEAE